MPALHEAFQKKTIQKQYIALLKGRWDGRQQRVTAPLQRYQTRSGERLVCVDEQGKPATTTFKTLRTWPDAQLVLAEPLTGRTHQIRVHAAYLGHPIAGDEKYGERAFNKQLRTLGLSHLFLHAFSLRLPETLAVNCHYFEVPLNPDLQTLLDQYLAQPT